MTWRAPTDMLGREIRPGAVVWIAVGQGSSAARMEQRRVVSVDAPLRSWRNADAPEEHLEGRVRVRWEPGLCGAGWRSLDDGSDVCGRPTYLTYPGRTLVHDGRDYDDLLAREHALSDAYLRLRALIPGAYDTPHAPTPEQVWGTTEAALRRALA